MTSYSVKDRSYYELDQEKRAKERLIKRSKEQIKKISDDIEISNQFSKSLLQTTPILTIDATVRRLTPLALKINDSVVYKTIANRLRWTVSETNSSNFFNDLTLIKYNINELYNKFFEIYKTIDPSKIADLKIIDEHIEDYYRAWAVYYDKLDIHFLGRNLANINAIQMNQRFEVDKYNYELVKTDVPNVRIVASDTFALAPNSRFTLNEIFYPSVLIHYKYNRLLRKIQKNIMMYINTHQEIKSGSGFAIPHHKTLHQYVQNHSNQMPQRFL